MRTAFVLSILGLLLPAIATATPTIELTALPLWGAAGTLRGRVAGIDTPAQYKIAPILYVDGLGWYSKPTLATPSVPLNADNTFAVSLPTVGLDHYANVYCVALGGCPAPC